jgi:KUP system potassium uptake protein
MPCAFSPTTLAGFFSLGAAVLALTGAEALYADMGHFGRKPIRLAWFGLVLPALVLNYFGQGALLLRDPAAIANPFYLLAPPGCSIRWSALATVATVIASQAVISGAFSITQQAIQLGYAPRMAISHTSDRRDRADLPARINWMLLLSVVALVIGYGSSSRLAAAYGIAVTGTMLITDVLAYVVARHLWGWSPLRALLGTLPFVAIDTAYLTANATKIADGGWFPLLFGACVFLLLSTWKRGRQLLTERLESNTLDMKDFATGIDGDLPRLPGTAVFLTPTPDRVPQSMLHTLKHFKALHERVVLVSVRIMDVPRIADTHRIVMERISASFWKVNVFYGFMDQPDLPEALAWCADSGLDLEPMETSFFLGRETLVPGIGAGMQAWREKLFVAMFRNAGDAAGFFRLPENRVVELGTRLAL